MTAPKQALEARVQTLEQEWATLRQELRDAATRVEALHKEVAWLRKRLASLLPERHHCPHCKSVVHKEATFCGACGKGWGPKPDPKAGLPG